MWGLIFFASPAVSFMITSLCRLFLSAGVLQQLAWIRRSVRNELEAESRSGQRLSLLNHSLLLFSCGFHPEWSPQLKKDKRHALVYSNTSRQVDFIAHYNNDDNDYNDNDTTLTLTMLFLTTPPSTMGQLGWQWQGQQYGWHCLWLWKCCRQWQMYIWTDR